MLIVNLEPDAGDALVLPAAVVDSCSEFAPVSVSGVSETVAALNTNKFGAIVVACASDKPDLHLVLQAFSLIVGPMPRLQAIYAQKKTAHLVNAAFESGVERFIGPNDLERGIIKLGSFLVSAYSKGSSRFDPVESQISIMVRAIRSAHQDQIHRAIAALQLSAGNDYRAAYCLGRGFESKSDFENAQSWYKKSVDLNPFFRPARFALAESKLIVGKHDESLELLLQLEREYSNEVDRKSALASVYVEKNDFATARKYASQAVKLAPDHSRTLEALALIHIHSKEYEDAFNLIDRMAEVGPYFAAKLNEFGILLSQTSELKTAFELYEKVHKVVRPALRFKISMNSALALRKMKDYQGALEMVQRCALEFGGSFPKLEKLKAVLLEELSSSRGAA